MEDSLLFEKKQKVMFIFLAQELGARKRNQKNIHPYPSSPYMERLKLRTAETDSSSCVLVSRDDAMDF